MASSDTHSRTRTPHEKSRNGCAGCKKRRVKCDETYPGCLNCEKRNLTCFYPNARPRKVEQMPPVSAIDCEVMKANIDSYVPNIVRRLVEWEDKNGSSIPTQRKDVVHFINSSSISTGTTQMDGLQLSKMNMNMTLESVRLPGSNGGMLYQSYISDTFMNVKAMSYYLSVFYYRVSPSVEPILPWCGIGNFATISQSLHHITLSLMYLSMYYDSLRPDFYQTDRVELKSLNDYMQLSQLNYDLYQSLVLRTNRKLDKDAIELLAELVGNKLEMLTMLYSPSLTMCDSYFIKRATFTQLLNNEIAKLLQPLHLKGDHVPFEYYLATHYPPLNVDCNVFFPKYLYQLCSDYDAEDSSPSSSSSSSSSSDYSLDGDTFSYPPSASSSSSVDEVSGNFYSPESENNSEEMDLYHAVRTLEREYIQCHNNEQPEKDGMRVFIRWPSAMTQTFARMLGEQDYRALIIMAHFLMLLACPRFESLLPRKLLAAEILNIDSVLSKNYKGWLLLPKTVLGL